MYGDEALEAYFEENEGNLVQSPKSMLGYNLHPRARQTIAGIATHILEHIRLVDQDRFRSRSIYSWRDGELELSEIHHEIRVEAAGAPLREPVRWRQCSTI